MKPDCHKPYQTGKERLKPVLTDSNRTQTGLDRLKLGLNGSNRTQKGTDRLKPVHTRPDRLKLAQTRPENLKPVFSGTNWAHTCIDQIKPGQTGSNQFDRLKPDSIRPRLVPIGFNRLKPGQTSSNRTKPAETGFDWLKPD